MSNHSGRPTLCPYFSSHEKNKYDSMLEKLGGAAEEASRVSLTREITVQEVQLLCSATEMFVAARRELVPIYGEIMGNMAAFQSTKKLEEYAEQVSRLSGKIQRQEAFGHMTLLGSVHKRSSLNPAPSQTLFPTYLHCYWLHMGGKGMYAT